MDEQLRSYLNDHLAGAAGAIRLVQSLADAQDDPAEAGFYRELKAKIERDRELLKGLLEKLGHADSGLRQVAGRLAAQVGKLKLWWEGLAPGELGTFETLEILVLGIQGKRVLWTALAQIAPRIPEWAGVSFADLEAEAIAQRDAVESRRMAAGVDALLSPERRAAKG